MKVKGSLGTEDIPLSFWEKIEKSQKDRVRMGEILNEMSKEEMIEFHWHFFDAAMIVSSRINAIYPDISEDSLDDISRWVVGQGRDYFLETLAHPERAPKELTPHSKEHLYYEIARVFIKRFDEDIWEYEDLRF